MPLARVVTFEGITSDRMEEMKEEMKGGEQPEGLDATEMIMLHDPESSKAVAILFFDTAEDYERGHEILDAMPSAETPGRRTSVERFDVPIRMTT